jgi:cytochrome c peroxidase
LVSILLSACTGEPPPEGVDPALWALCSGELDFDAEDCLDIQAWRLPDELPPARGNLYADDLDAAALGRAIFFDPDFGAIEGVSCSSCHLPHLAFQDARPTSEVIEGSPVPRNSPSLYNAAWNTGFFFWDGRADSMWSQPLFAFENEIEMDATRLEIAHRVSAEYRSDYEAIFGPLPALDDGARFPPRGKPGEESWENMSAEDRDAVDGVVANVGKALEAYMRRIAAGPSALDRYLAGDPDALEDDEVRGLVRFVRSGCANCHSGPALADDRFHPSAIGSESDRGRASGIEILLANPFNSEGPHFDRDAGPALELPSGATEDDERAFRTPSMRNLALSAPYQHDGSRSLEQILSVRGLLYEEGDEIVLDAFVRALDGEPPPIEWASPPN